MKHFLILFIMYFSFVSSKAQIVTPAVLNSATTKGSAGNISFELSLGEIFTTTISNVTVITQGFLQPMVQSSNSPLPVLGLEFSAKRINKQQVQLDWKTLQEINNKGFAVERKKENENNFVALRFITSKASGGNSSMPLTYSSLDTNAFAGKTYYRLNQQDLNGQSSYSVIRTVNGDETKIVTLKAWPIPAKDFYVQVESNDAEIIQIVDVSGRIVRTYKAVNVQPFLVSGLPSGSYFVKLQNKPDVIQKVIVQ